MKYLSVCSGIEAATVAWHGLGWTPVGFSEIEPFPSAVLAHHFPEVPNYGDMTKYKEWPDLDVDLLVGGTPCQSFSLAGLREGLNDPRGNLTLTFLSIVEKYKPKYIVWENVPGILSDKTNALKNFLDGLNDIGYMVDVDILDAQFFGVPQRRRRIFVCGQNVDYLLKSKTNLSAIITVKCLVEIFQDILIGQWYPLEKEQAHYKSQDHVSDGLLKKMKLLDLCEGKDGLERLQDCLTGVLQRHHPEVKNLGLKNGGFPKEHILDDLSMASTTDAQYLLTEESLKKLLGESCEVMKSCIISTSTKMITDHQICTCFKTVVLIGKLICLLRNSCPFFLNMESLFLTVIRDYTKYARQTSNNLFANATNICEWNNLIEEAENIEQIVGCLGDWRPAAAVLFERESLCRDTAPRRESGEEIARSIKNRSGDRGQRVEYYENHGQDSRITGPCETAETVAAKYGTGGNNTPIVLGIPGNWIGRNPKNGGNATEPMVDVSPCLTKTDVHAGCIPPIIMAHGQANAEIREDGQATTLTCNHEAPILAFAQNSRNELREMKVVGALSASPGMKQTSYIRKGSIVRRLIPTECERLQGFPDGWTRIPWKKKPPEKCPDAPRYKAIGNSMAVPVMRWIGERIQAVEDIINKDKL